MKTVSLPDARKEQKAETSPYETLALTIDEAGVEHLMGTLTNLYSRPAEAVFREYVSNALDSHLKAKQTQPIEINLHDGGYTTVTGVSDPNIGYFQVTDHGTGMSKDDVVNVYSRYASSTKRDSNEQIGAFGLGAKSALAISNRFEIVSIKDGVELKFYIKKNDRGVGVVHFVSENPTKQSNGVTITIPLSANALETMRGLVKNGFFKTWKPKSVILNGAALATEETVYDKNQYLPFYMGTHELGWVRYVKATSPAIFSNYNAYSYIPSISIAGISYKLQVEISKANVLEPILSTDSSIFLQRMYNFGMEVILNLPIGSVDLTPNREEIMLTEKTISALQQNINVAAEEIPLLFKSHLNSKKTHKEAWDFYTRNMVGFDFDKSYLTSGRGAMARHGVRYSTIHEPINLVPTSPNKDVTYKGEPIPHFFDATDIKTISSVNASAWQEKWRKATQINLVTAYFDH